MKAAYYSKQAEISFGVIASIFTLSAVLNTLVARFFFNQRLNAWKYGGIFVIILGVMWTS